jgi:hypothetical protein
LELLLDADAEVRCIRKHYASWLSCLRSLNI